MDVRPKGPTPHASRTTLPPTLRKWECQPLFNPSGNAVFSYADLREPKWPEVTELLGLTRLRFRRNIYHERSMTFSAKRLNRWRAGVRAIKLATMPAQGVF